jgi:hypothetical protein
MRRRYHYTLMLAIGILLLCQTPVRADPAPDQRAAIEVEEIGGTLIVDASILVPATLNEAWEVLTDYDHMADYLHHIQFSKIIAGADNRIQVAQKGHASYGPLSFSFDTVREVELKPYLEIRSKVISGSIKQGRGTFQLTAEKGGTRIVYHNETVSNQWLPPLIGPAMVRKEIRLQFEEMKNEILRRRLEKQRNERPAQG